MLNELGGHILINSPSAAVLTFEDQTPVTLLLLRTLPVAAMLLDIDGRLVQANLAARKLLELEDGLKRAVDGHVVASLPPDRDRLRKLVSTLTTEMAADDRAIPIPPLWLQRPSGYPPLLLVFDAIPLPSFHGRTKPPMLLLRVLHEDRGTMGRLAPVRTAFNLTSAETRVAEQIAIGRSPSETAEHLALSRNTVRTHLARIFDKTGVRSQHALVRLMLVLSSWPTV